MKVERERCGNCHHGAHPSGPCHTSEVTGPPSDHPANGGHGDRTVTPCDCQEHAPAVNGAGIV